MKTRQIVQSVGDLSRILIFTFCLTLLAFLTSCATGGPLHKASWSGDTEKARALIDAGADVNQKLNPGLLVIEPSGVFPLFYAAKYGHADTVRLLIERGADVNAKSNCRANALGAAARWGHTDIVKILLDAGAEVNVKDCWSGGTPLTYATLAGNSEIVRLLLEADADPGIANSSRKTPIQLAYEMGHTGIVSMLRKAEEERYGVPIGSVPGTAFGISAKDYFNQGMDYGRSGDYQQSIRSFTRAIELNPGYAKAYFNRGVSYFKLDNDQLALYDFNKAIELSPRYADPYHVRGRIYATSNQYWRSIRDCNKAIELKPRFAEAYYTRGLANLYQGKHHQQAINDFTKTVELKPMFAEAYFARGMAYFSQGNDEKGVEDYKTAARMGIKEAEDRLKRKSQARNPTWVPGKWVKKGDKWHWNTGHYDSGTKQVQVRTTSITEANAPSWIHQKINASGAAVIDTKRWQSLGRAKLYAKRGARIQAKRRLLEQVLDLIIDSQNTVRNVLAEPDLNINNGIIRNSYTVGQESNDNVYRVTEELKLNEVYSYMKEKSILYK